MRQSDDAGIYIPLAHVGGDLRGRNGGGTSLSFSAGLIELHNRSGSPAVIEEIRPLGVHPDIADWRLQATWMARGWPFVGASWEWDPYPPERALDIEELVLPPVEDAPGPLQVLVSIRLADGAREGWIDGFVVRYDIGGIKYEQRLENVVWLSDDDEFDVDSLPAGVGQRLEDDGRVP